MYSRKFNNAEPPIPSDYSGVAYSPQGITGQNIKSNSSENNAAVPADNLGNVPRVPFDEMSASMKAPASRHGTSVPNHDYGMPVRSAHEMGNFDVPVMARAKPPERNRAYPPSKRFAKRPMPPRSDNYDYPYGDWNDRCEYPRREEYAFDGKLSDGNAREPKGKKGNGLLSGLTSLTKHSFSMEDIILAGLILLLMSDENADMDILLILGFLLLIGL